MSDGGLYTAMSGGTATSKQLDITANNLANINTNAYKKDKTIFKEQLAKINFEDITQAQAEDAEFPPRVLPIDKHNVLVEETYTDFTQGMLEKTNNPLNVALNGKGFFKVNTPQGIRYTRDGNFIISKDGILVTSDGYSVLDENENEIELGNKKTITINENGSIYSDKQEVGKLATISFNNLASLKKIGKNLYEQTDKNATEIQSEASVLQGFLESSNVNPVEEMVNLISLQRQFELNGKAIESFSETDKKATGDLGRV